MQTNDQETSAKTVFRIPAMDCASEEAQIRRALQAIPSITALGFQFGDRLLTVHGSSVSAELAARALKQAGFVTEQLHQDPLEPAMPRGVWEDWGKLIASLLLAIAAEVLSFIYGDLQPASYVGMLVAATAIWFAGFDVYKKGLLALWKAKLNINALMTVAVTGAFLIGQWPEAAMVMALYALAESIEARAVDRARNAIKSLLKLVPEDAEVFSTEGKWVRTELKQISLGAIVRLRPGERVPLDGIVTLGQTAIDQSAVTGESLPVDKGLGDRVLGGTINQSSAIEMRVTAVESESTLARIIHTVEQAQSAQAPTQRFVDQFAAVYTPAIFVIAVAVAVLSPILFDWTWLQALYKALVLLVIACPCALIISTPVSVVSGLAAAARRGILIKGGVYLEQARKIKAIALDKTGTITEGKPALLAFEPVDPSADIEHLKALAASLAARSDHPVSKAIAAAMPNQRLDVASFEAKAGRGVQGHIAGETVVLANHRWIEERRQCSTLLEARLEEHELAGRTITLLANDEQVLALCVVADTIKPSSARAIEEIKALGVTPIMLTGDNLATAQTVAAQAGIHEVQGNLLPEDKLQAIANLQKQYGVTAMSGDGINDAPALTKADIGFAMGAAGTDIAAQAADIVVMNDDLRRLPETIRLSKRTHAVLWQNISIALGIKLVFLVMAVVGSASMWMAVFADMGASLLVVLNGLRLLRPERTLSRNNGKSDKVSTYA